MSFEGSLGFCSKSSGGSQTPRRTPRVPLRANPEVGRIRFLSYVSAAMPRWNAFYKKRCGLRGDMTRQESDRLATTLERHGRKRAEFVLRIPVECTSEILSYLPPPRYPEPWLKIDRKGKHEAEALYRCMVSHSVFYFMILENDYVNHSERSARAPIPAKIRLVLERRIRRAQKCHPPPRRRARSVSPASPEHLAGTQTLNATSPSRSLSASQRKTEDLNSTTPGKAEQHLYALSPANVAREQVKASKVPQHQPEAEERPRPMTRMKKRPILDPIIIPPLPAEFEDASEPHAPTVHQQHPQPQQPQQQHHQPEDEEEQSRPMTHMKKRPTLDPIVIPSLPPMVGDAGRLPDTHEEHASPSPALSHHSQDAVDFGHASATSSIEYQEAEDEVDEDEGGELECLPASMSMSR